VYKKILVALENTAADQALLPHVAELATKLSSQLLLMHVADGWAARHFDRLKLVESEEIKQDREYLERTAEKLREKGITVGIQLAMGDPATELIKAAQDQKCDLIAMGSHGHRLIGDIILGSTIHAVRHRTSIPVLSVRAKGK
jgi:nucleotide-binding universal stress UspA family protein